MCVWEISTALLLNCDEGSKWTSFRPAEKGRPEQTSYKIFVWSKTRLTKIKLLFIRPSSFTWRNAIPVPTAPRIYNWLSVKLSSFMMQPPCMCEKVKMKWFFFFFFANWANDQNQIDRSSHLHIVYVGWMVPDTTEVIRSFTAAVRNKTCIICSLDPHTVFPVCVVVTAAAHELRSSRNKRNRDRWG